MSNFEVSRRRFIRSTLGISAVALLDATLPTGILPTIASSAIVAEKKRYFAPVKVERSRLIRTIVGLRPFRREGFVVEASRIADKYLVHNYGHGGAGITLSWGTSSMAVDHVRNFICQLVRGSLPYWAVVLWD